MDTAAVVRSLVVDKVAVVTGSSGLGIRWGCRTSRAVGLVLARSKVLASLVDS